MVDRSAWEVSMTAPGMLIAGRYRLVERIAAGGMGWVWEAWDELLHRKVAVKQLLRQPGLAAEDAELARRRLIREARITARLHHPHVVSLYDVVEHDGGPCLIMQYVPSRSLSALLQDRGVLREAAVLRIGAEVAAGLAAAHEVGIVHRDVKPANVLITEDGAAKLTDFGISHAVGDANLTATGMVTGTPAYLAPEVARGGVSGFPADVFSFGATLYAALEGTPPFGTDPNPMAVLHRVASGKITPPQRSGGLTPLLSQMLAVEPGERPTMADVASTLAARQTEMSAVPDLLQALTVALPPRTLREWPAESAPAAGAWLGLVEDGPAASAPTAGAWPGLVEDGPGASAPTAGAWPGSTGDGLTESAPAEQGAWQRLVEDGSPEPEPTVAAPPPTAAEPMVDRGDDVEPRRAPVVLPPADGRPWKRPVVAALIALVVAGVVLIGVALARSSRTVDDAGSAGTDASVGSAESVAPAEPVSSVPEAAASPESSAEPSPEPSPQPEPEPEPSRRRAESRAGTPRSGDVGGAGPGPGG